MPSTLNHNKPFGEIHPPVTLVNTDRPAAFEQDGKCFDAHEREIIAGVPLADMAFEANENYQRIAAREEDLRREYSPNELIAGANTLPSGVFQREAKRILGPICPAGKVAQLEALKKAMHDYKAKKAKRRTQAPRSAPDAPDADPPDIAEPVIKEATPAKAPAKSKSAKDPVDLAAWGRGEKDRLFGDVRKAIRKQFNVQIAGDNERFAAVDLLIREGVISAEEARQDVSAEEARQDV